MRKNLGMKRVFAFVLLLTLLISTMPITFASSILTVNGILKPGYTLTAVCDGETLSGYQWSYSDTVAGSYTNIALATSADYILTNDMSAKYIKAIAITASQNTIESTPCLIDAALPKGASTLFPAGTNPENTDYMFTVDLGSGNKQRYYLLDETNDSNSKFFVLSANTAAAGIFDLDANTVKLDLADPKNVVHWLNNIWFNNTWGATMPVGAETTSPINAAGYRNAGLAPAMRNYVDTNHIWLTGAGTAASDTPNDYTIKCGVSLLSLPEFNAYYDKLSVKSYNYPNSATMALENNWWLRTPNAMSTTSNISMLAVTKAQISFSDINATGHLIRPCLYLNDKFFKEVRLDLTNTGAKVKERLLSYNAADFNGLYTTQELEDMEFFKTPITNVTFTGTPTPGYVLDGSYSFSGTGEYSGGSVYSWYSCATETGTYALIAGATAKQFTVTNAVAGKYVKVGVTPKAASGTLGTVKMSDISVCINSALTAGSHLTTFPTGAPDTNPDNMFTVNLPNSTYQRYYLLNTTGDDNSKFFVLSANVVAMAKFQNDGTTTKLNMSNPLNIGNWLNNVWLDNTWATEPSDITTTSPITAGSYKFGMAAALKPYIDTNHVWLTEAGRSNSDTPNDYTTKCGVSLLSIKEFNTYYSKIGLRSYTAPNATSVTSGHTIWWLRTPNAASSSTNYFLAINSAAFTSTLQTASTAVRPCLYLNNEFFKNVKFNVADLGSEVKKAIVANYGRSELAGIYSDTELTAIGFSDSYPIVENVSVAGGSAVGETLLGKYTYRHTASVPLGTVKYQWFISNTSSGTYSAIDGQTNATYVLKSGDAGKFIKVKITAVDADGGTSAPVYSEPTLAIRPEQNFTVKSAIFYDGSSNIVTSLSGITTLKVKFEINNKVGTTQNLFTALVIYDSSNTIVAIKSLNQGVKAGTDFYTVTIDSFNYQAGYTAKAMVWNNANVMQPICGVKIP